VKKNCFLLEISLKMRDQCRLQHPAKWHENKEFDNDARINN
jgi:hypothetical protein